MDQREHPWVEELYHCLTWRRRSQEVTSLGAFATSRMCVCVHSGLSPVLFTFDSSCVDIDYLWHGLWIWFVLLECCYLYVHTSNHSLDTLFSQGHLNSWPAECRLCSYSQGEEKGQRGRPHGSGRRCERSRRHSGGRHGRHVWYRLPCRWQVSSFLVLVHCLYVYLYMCVYIYVYMCMCLRIYSMYVWIFIDVLCMCTVYIYI